MNLTFKHTIRASFCSLVVQAIAVNFVPLLFLTFRQEFGLSFTQLTLLITVNFSIQMATDIVSALLVDKIGYRFAEITAQMCVFSGLMLLTVLPSCFENGFIGLVIADVMYSIGAGILEVVSSPLVEACPTKNKEAAMSLLHSFYAWGHFAIVILSTLFFTVFGIQNWRIAAILLSLVPLVNGIYYCFVPIPDTVKGKKDNKAGFSELFSMLEFRVLLIVMVCVGASEQALAQWASTFVEDTLGVNKSVGDVLGPAFFALCMALSRTFYGKFGDKIDLERALKFSAALCIISYALIAVSPFAFLGLLGCGLCGLSVGLVWPGTLSLAAGRIKNGQTVMFAMLALAGDIGCNFGPSVAGFLTEGFSGNLKVGIGFCVIFPTVLYAGYSFFQRRKKS